MWTLILRDLNSRYKVTYIGFFWSLLRPILFASVLWVVGKLIIRFDPPYKTDYGFFLIVGLLPWTFLSTALTDASQSYVQNAALIRKVYFPRLVFPLSAVGAGLINFALASTAIFGALILTGVFPLSPSFLAFPGILLLQMLFLTPIAVIVAVSNVYFRDTSMLLEFGLQAWFYLTPVFYPISLPLRAAGRVPEWLVDLYPALNPMAPITHAYRRCLLGGLPTDPSTDLGLTIPGLLGYLGCSLLWSLLLILVATVVYRKYQGGIADEV